MDFHSKNGKGDNSVHEENGYWFKVTDRFYKKGNVNIRVILNGLYHNIFDKFIKNLSSILKKIKFIL